jgi:hypothetical protein
VTYGQLRLDCALSVAALPTLRNNRLRTSPNVAFRPAERKPQDGVTVSREYVAGNRDHTTLAAWQLGRNPKRRLAASVYGFRPRSGASSGLHATERG